MTTNEKITLICRIANSWQGMNRYAFFSIQHYPHKEEGDWQDGEWCFDAEVNSSEYCGYRKLSFIARTIDDAVTGLLGLVRKELTLQLESRRARAGEAQRELEYLESEIRTVEGAIAEGSRA